MDEQELLEKKKQINWTNIIIKISKVLLILFDIFLIFKDICFNGSEEPNTNINICLCTIGKKENLYAKEYVEHYKKIGYNHLYIYDNNDINDEKFEDVLQKEVSENFVTIIDLRGYDRAKGAPQFVAYRDCYEKNKNKCDWLSFFDFDEFLEVKEKKVQNFFSDKIFNKCDNIKINWLMYSDNDLIHYENKSIQERFTIPLVADPSNYAIKSTVRGNLRYNYWKDVWNPHTSEVKYVACNSFGQIIASNAYHNIPPIFDKAYIKHYATKTLEEYFMKMRRGYPDYTVYYNDNTLKQYFDYFFKRNKITQEKLDYIKKEFNYTYIP
mgnify:CR=1 FL=1